jgi:ribose transport system substrate-binding protein
MRRGVVVGASHWRAIGLGLLLPLVAGGSALAQGGTPGAEGELACETPATASFRVGSVVWDASWPYLGAYVEAQQEAADCLAIDLEIGDGRADAEVQVDAIEHFVADGMDLIVVGTSFPDGIAPAVRQARAAGVPIIETMIPIEGVDAVTWVTYEAGALGRAQAKMVAAELGETGRLGVVRGPAHWWSSEIAAGLREGLADHPGIELVEHEAADGDQTALLAAVETLLSDHPRGELAGVVVEVAGVLAAQELAEGLGREEVAFFGAEYDDDIRQALIDGRLRGTLLEDPRAIGRASIEDAAHWLGGEQAAVSAPEHDLAPVTLTAAEAEAYPPWPAWPAAEPTGAAEPTPAPALTATPEPTGPPAGPLASGYDERTARRMCQAARPRNVYGVRSRVRRERAARKADYAQLVMVEYRDLRGRRLREPRLRSDTIYDVSGRTPFDWSTADEIDLLACVALRATQRETWQETSSRRMYTMDAADAIVWMVDAVTGKRVGRPWLQRPPKPRSPTNYVFVGRGGPGLRPPPEDVIVADIGRFMGR